LHRRRPGHLAHRRARVVESGMRSRKRRRTERTAPFLFLHSAPHRSGRDFAAVALAFVALVDVSCLAMRGSNPGIGVHAPGTSRFEHQVASLCWTPSQAWDLLREKIQDRRDRFVDHAPLRLIGSSYLFAEPHKTRIELTGFYVDGR